MKSMAHFIRFAFSIVVFLLSGSSYAQNDISFLRINSDNGLPCDETNCITQDEEGLIWIGSLYGLYTYDGYQVKVINEMSGKNIRNISDSKKGFLWVGTYNGLYKMEKNTHKVRLYNMNEYENCNVINKVFTDSNDSIWVATNGGLYSYDEANDTLIFRYNMNHNSIIPHCSVTDICEDDNGYLWLGTWDKGLYRYNSRKGEWYQMPKFNEANSAQKLCYDQSGHLWVGTWNYGIYDIKNPYDTHQPLQFTNYINQSNTKSSQSIIGNYIYSFCANKQEGSIWIGTNNGLSIAKMNDDGNLSFENYPKETDPSTAFLGTGVESLFRDYTGRIWMCTTQYGVFSARRQTSMFKTLSYISLFGNSSENITDCLTCAPDGSVYVGLKNIGFARIQDITGNVTADIFTKELTGQQQIYKSRCVYILRNGGIAAGTESNGFFIKMPGKLLRSYTKGNPEWLNDQCVKAFYEEDNGSLIVGNWKGISVLYNDESGRNISQENGNDQFINSHINQIVKAGYGDYWLASSNNGIINVKGDLSDKGLNAKNLRIRFHKELTDVSRILLCKNGDLWACSRAEGLFKYDKNEDCFVNMISQLSFPAQIISDMEEDNAGNIWLTTNLGIIRLSQNPTRIRIFTKSDGLPTNYLGRSLIRRMPNGDMCVSYTDYITVFTPSEALDKPNIHPAHLTGVKIFNDQITFPEDNHLTLEPDENDITIEFSTLTYDDLSSTRFSYMMDGYDHDWIYPSIGSFYAYYSNLPAGSYTFRLRSADASGIWNESEERMTIKVLQPLYLRWWAVLGYVLAFLTSVFLIFRYYKHKREQEEKVRMAKLQAEQVEELNHKKLQFYTNISHDLMTPLTIISAITESTSEQSMPQKNVMQNNVNKLIRMLQQILEFRKVESGNLRLKVVERDIVAFCRSEVDSIAPLMHSKGIDIEFYSNQGSYKCWFDVDALDKIIYNLLANAAKYCTGNDKKVNLMLSCGNTTKISIIDNGSGIPEQKQKDLFKRFYEGEHRKFNTYGTGIGLSLVKDLSVLHHGTIDVESKEGVGTTFIVSIPVTKSDYSEMEIEGATDFTQPETFKPETETAPQTDDKTPHDKTILIVEDNEELLQIVKDTLAHHYNVLTSGNGREAIEMMRTSEEVIDLVLSDVMMPEMDGMELTERIKNDIETSHIPVLLLTAKRTDEDRTAAYRIGADGYITKPFSMEMLLARVENLLKRRQIAVKSIETQISKTEDYTEPSIQTNDETPIITTLDTLFIKRCRECVMNHIDDTEFDQQVFADEMNVSKSTLYKKLRALTNMNTPKFIRSIRMNMAVNNLKTNPHIRISELAYSVGFNDPKYFSQCFKADFGVLPSDYINNDSASLN